MKFLLLLALLGLIKADDASGYQGCYDPSKPASEQKVTIGKPTFICLMIGAGDDWSSGINYIRLNFAPDGDEYSRFHVPGSYRDLVVEGRNTIFGGQNITIGVATQNALSFVRKYFDTKGNGFIYPHLTAIIDVQGGVVRGITWDDACVFCGGNECDEITYDYNGNLSTKKESGQPSKGCYVPSETCNQNVLEQTENICDITLYVVWTGSDSNGKSLLSSSFRFSVFPAQEIQDRITRNLPQLPSFPGSGNEN